MKLEICSNHEWWRVFGPLDTDDDDVVDEAISATCRALEDAGHTAELSRGPRARCHGWNGANTFRRKYGGIGTFETVTDEEWDAVTSLMNAAWIRG